MQFKALKFFLGDSAPLDPQWGRGAHSTPQTPQLHLGALMRICSLCLLSKLGIDGPSCNFLVDVMILQILHYHCIKQHKNFKNLLFIQQNIVISFCPSLCLLTVTCASFTFLNGRWFLVLEHITQKKFYCHK